MKRWQLQCGRRVWPVRDTRDLAVDDAIAASLASRCEYSKRVYLDGLANIVPVR